MGSALQDALKKVELLIDQLQSGNFVGIGAALPVPDKLLPAPKSQAKAAKSAAVPKEKPAKAKASGAGGGGGAAIEGPELLAKAHLAVARVTSVVEHPNSDKTLHHNS
ncbi:hypothetical protein Ndes2526B_g01196 [Nannochloris sp. 'desiccata']